MKGVNSQPVNMTPQPKDLKSIKYQTRHQVQSAMKPPQPPFFDHISEDFCEDFFDEKNHESQGITT
jgi:hypothetical protein